MSDPLTAFDQLIVKIREIFLEENSLLKSGNLGAHAALMERKKALLAELDSSLLALKEAREDKTRGGGSYSKEQARGLQDKIMQLMMLDRENEQLLLKRSMGGGSFGAQAGTALNTSALEKLTKAL